MKKRFSAFTLVLVGFLMMAVGVGATAGYVNWAGSQDFEEAKVNHSKLRIEINKLFGVNESLELTRNELESELNRLEGLIKNSGNDDIESLIDERDNLNTKLVSSQEKIKSVIDDTNGINGKGPRYDELRKGINELSSLLYDYPATGAPVINDNHGNGPKSEELEQAVKDMKAIKDESSDLLDFIEEGKYDESLTE